MAAAMAYESESGGQATIIFFLILFGSWMLRKLVDWMTAPSQEEADIESRIGALQREARRLDSVSTFVQWSKVQRKLQTLEKQREQLRSERRQKRVILSDNPIFVFLLKHFLSTMLLPAVIIAWWWNEPIMTVEPSTFGPSFVASWLAIPGWSAGTVGIVAWVAICRSVARLFPI